MLCYDNWGSGLGDYSYEKHFTIRINSANDKGFVSALCL